MRQCDPIADTEQPVHRHGVIQRLPARGRVFRTTGDEEWPRRHEREQFVQVVAVFDQSSALARPPAKTSRPI